ncbi:hypothetical protein CEY12_05725 [Chryseobacterium sp. T16E-39]|uniref:tetratricopeptide repeat protein n=1 Tax=Chryseobacterium sp. T16E-39 TaxID=2015076 RepID=UPI000B5B21B7|nr:hypothetical protein [Chryseobacterium sp. T16E-39]ASK29633.1 hypothetical protein CEY12_05725 [Chryseobacterium sp. T16E-39]
MHNNKILKTSIFFIVFIIFYFDAPAQTSTKEIDSVGQLLEKNYLKGDNNPGLTLKNATVLYYLSKEKEFYPGQVYSIFEEVKLYHLNGDFDSALSKVNEGLDLAKKENDDNMICRILLLYQRVLLQLDHLSAAKYILERAEDYNKSVKIKEDKLINDVYIQLAKAELLTIREYFDEKTINEIIKLKKFAYSESLKIKDSNSYKKVTVIYTLESLAVSLARFKKIDEARKYSQIIDQFLISYADDTFLVRSLIIKGIIEKQVKNYSLAIDYFSKAIVDSQKDHNRYEQYEVYAMMAECYDGMKDFENATYFSKKYKRIVDSVDLVKKKSGDVNFINKINLKVSDKNETETIQTSDIIIGVGAIFSAGLILFFYLKNNRKKKVNSSQKEIKKVAISSKPDEEILTDNTILNTTTESTKELILLAKEDINAFYIEFQKIYPNFYPTLKNKYAELNISDINFCSLLKMNFGIKEISQYTNSTIRAAEARRYRINKKMQLKNQNELYMVLSSIN